jgi:pyruvate dehydrogenase E1 component alpha subunit
MPRERIEIESAIDLLSILDENGEVDRKLEPDLSEDLLLEMFDRMVLTRRFDEQMLSLQKQGRLGTFAPVRGQEAAQIGSVATLLPSDWVVPSYRELGVAVWREMPLDGLLMYDAGFNEGGAIPEDQLVLPIAVPVGSQMLHAAGIAYALRQRGDGAIVMTYFGDGATSEGDFHEAMNFAAVFDCPCVFVCENNQYAISVPRAKQTRSETLAQKAIAYGMPSIQVDGNDVLAVHEAAAECVERARRESRPSLIECLTYRLGVHTTVDDPSKYRSDEEVAQWEKRDPLPRFQQYLLDEGVLDEKRIGKAEGIAEEAIRRAVERWEEAMGEAADPALMFDHVYAEPTVDLERQREAFEEQWRARPPELRLAGTGMAPAEQGEAREDETEAADAAGEEEERPERRSDDRASAAPAGETSGQSSEEPDTDEAGEEESDG